MPERFIVVNDVNLYVEYDNLEKIASFDDSDASPGKAPVVMVHGWTADRFRNYPVYQHLKRIGWPVLCYDLRGHGWSQKGITGHYSIDDCVNDLEAIVNDFLFQKFHYERFNLYGHSLGGTIALKYAYLFPGAMEHLFLLAPFVKSCVSEEMIVAMDMLIESYEKRFDREFRRKKREQAKLGLEFFPHWEDETLFPEKDAVIELGHDLLDTDLDYTLMKSLTVPTHVIIGERDRPDLKKSAKMLADVLKNATYDLLESGHAYAIERRDVVPGLIEKYLLS
ncbi:MAG: alpha/beta fold hydrolase [Promethearchaeota archaeon]